jgi:hypothetical protein
MPGHLYIRLGRWHDAVTTNQAALRADEAGVKRWDGFLDFFMTSVGSQYRCRRKGVCPT